MVLIYVKKTLPLVLPSVHAVNASNTTESHSQPANMISLREIISSHRLAEAEPPLHSPGAWKKSQRCRTQILKEGKTEVYPEVDISSLLLQQPKHDGSLPHTGQFSVRKRTKSHIVDWL